MEYRIYKGNYGYAYQIRDGELKKYINVCFKKGIEPQAEQLDIVVTKGFYKPYLDKNKICQEKLIVMEYTIKESVEIPPEITTQINSDLPF